MVNVDYATLCQMIQRFAYTGIFRTRVAASRAQQAGYIELHAQRGIIAGCSFTTLAGVTTPWDLWDQRLARLGTLRWEQSTGNALASLTKPLPAITNQPHSSHIPYQTTTLSQTKLYQLPIAYRRVYFLMDGKRRVMDIASILQKSEGEIFQIIEYFVKIEAAYLYE